MDGQEETHFDNLFKRALEWYVNHKGLTNCYQEIFHATEYIKNSFIQMFHYYIWNEINFDSTVYVAAYFNRYSTLNASVARKRCLRAFENCGELQSLIQNTNLRIVSLGGGPGTDMIGFLSAMRSFMSGTGTSLDLIVSDKWGGWQELHDGIQQLIGAEIFGNVSDIYRNHNVSSRFMQIDLLNTDCQIIQSTDIVLLVRVLGILKFDDEKRVLEVITSAMKNGALLFILDLSDRKGYTYIHGLEILYQEDIEEYYVLSVSVAKLFGIQPSTSCKCSIAVCKKIQ